MKNNLSILTMLSIALFSLLTACKKTDPPSVAFTSGKGTADVIRLGTTDTTRLTSFLQSASSLAWDFGDGRYSIENNPTLSYEKPGTYTLTLRAKTESGKNIEAVKKIVVLDRVLKRIVIDRIYWTYADTYFAQAGLSEKNTGSVYVKIQKLEGNETYKNGFSPNATVIYSSPLMTNISKSTIEPISINVSSKVNIMKDNLRDKYLITLIAKEGNVEYAIFANNFSGANQLVKEDNIDKNSFVFMTALIGSIHFFCEFE